MENFEIQKNKMNMNCSKFIHEETKMINRKDMFGSGIELEKLQDEFLKTSNEKNLSVKVVKNKTTDTNKFSMNQNFSTKDNSTPMKKKKDIIKMDIHLESGHNFKENKLVSIFKYAMENQKELADLKSKNISKDTGLPETFKVDLQKFKSDMDHNSFKNDKNKIREKNSKEIILNKISFGSNQIENTEYKNIHETNISAIKKMTDEELIQFQQMIKAKIPDKLREKMSTGYFQKKIREESNKLNLKEEILDEGNKSDKFDESNEDKGNLEKEKLKTNSSENFELKNPSENDSNLSKVFTLHVNYNGKFLLSKEKDKIVESKTIDYSKYKLNEVDLEIKYFSINEIHNFLASSSEPQIILGLKLSIFLINFYFDQDHDNELIVKKINPDNFKIINATILIRNLRKQIADVNFWNIFYFLMEYKNLHVNFLALKVFTNFVWSLFRDNFKMFKMNFFKFANFPAIKLFHTGNYNLNENYSSENNLKIVELFNINIQKNLMYIKNSFFYFNTTIANLEDDITKIEENLSNTMKFLFFCFYFSEDFMESYLKSEVDSLLIGFLTLNNQLLSKQSSSEIRKIIKKVFLEIFLQATSVEIIKKYQKIFEENNIEYLSCELNLNFILILRGVTLEKTKILTIDGVISFKNILKSHSAVAYNILLKLANQKNLELFSDNYDFRQISDYYLSTINLSNCMIVKKDLLKFTKFLQLKMKLCKYSNYNESEDGDNGFEFWIMSKVNEINYLQEVFLKSIIDADDIYKKISNSNFFSLPILIDLNTIFEFWNTVLTFYQFSIRCPKSIKYMKTIDNKNFDELFLLTLKFTKYFSDCIEKSSRSQSNQSEEGKSSSTAKIQYLYKIENFTKFLLNFLKYFSQPHLEIKEEIPNLFFTFATFLNTNCEHYYNRFIKYLALIFYKKSNDKKIQNFLKQINFSFEELCVDLNLYLGSNEDLRKSTIMKKNLHIEENLMNLMHRSNKIDIDKSKFLPFNKNFILQIVFNNKIKSELKLNYMTLLIVLFYNENSQIQKINFFEIFLKILNNYNDEINGKNDKIIFSEFIKSLILFQNSSKIKEISLNKSLDNEIQFEMFFDKFDFSNSNDSKIEFYYKFIIVLIQFFHSNKNQKQNFNIDKLNLIIYSSFLPIFENTGIKSLAFFDEDSKKLYVDFIIDSLSMQNVEFYEVSIMSYFKFLINNKKFISGYREDNVFFDLIEGIVKKLKLIDDNDEDRLQSIEKVYLDYLEDRKVIRQKLEKLLK